MHESLPNVNVTFPKHPSERPMGVYTDNEIVAEMLTDKRFKLLSSMAEADVLWTRHYLKNFK